MPRGDKDGSVIHVPARREGRRIVEPERWEIRRRYTVTVNGKKKQREKSRVAYSASEAIRVKRDVDREIDRELAGENKPAGQRTFAELVTLAKQNDLKPAEYIGDTKVGGMRSYKSVLVQLTPLEEFFGRMPVAEITYQDVEDYKRMRLKAPTKRERPRSIASVNRELALLRRLFFIALREPWISVHPFHRGRPLIHVADEVKRMRILSSDEEDQLLDACSGRRGHLRLQIIFAIETGMRLNEQRTLQLRDIDLNDRIITLRAFNSKTAQPRIIPIFDRLARELEIALTGRTRRDGEILRLTVPPSDLLFPDGCPRKAFEGARLAAGLEDLRWHDLRHTAITRMLHTYRLQEAEVMRISGHQNYKTFLRYVNLDREMMRSIRERVDSARGVIAPPPVPIPTAESEAIDLGQVSEVSQ